MVAVPVDGYCIHAWAGAKTRASSSAALAGGIILFKYFSTARTSVRPSVCADRGEGTGQEPRSGDGGRKETRAALWRPWNDACHVCEKRRGVMSLSRFGNSKLVRNVDSGGKREGRHARRPP